MNYHCRCFNLTEKHYRSLSVFMPSSLSKHIICLCFLLQGLALASPCRCLSTYSCHDAPC